MKLADLKLPLAIFCGLAVMRLAKQALGIVVPSWMNWLLLAVLAAVVVGLVLQIPRARRAEKAWTMRKLHTHARIADDHKTMRLKRQEIDSPKP